MKAFISSIRRRLASSPDEDTDPTNLDGPSAPPVLCDFGEARFGNESYGERAMPDLHRAPEILLQIEWNEKIDTWALGLVVSISRRI